MLPRPGLHVTLISYRLGGADGVSVAAEQWITAFRRSGVAVRTVAGDGRADVLIPGLAIDATSPVDRAALVDAVADADVVVADNIGSLPINPTATEAVLSVLAGRRAIFRHHDFTWERARFRSTIGLPRDDPAWIHVTISEHARRNLLGRRGVSATTVYHGVSDEQARPSTRRAELRAHLQLAPGATLVLQPTRAIERKRIDRGLAVATELGATYWLTGPAEEGYHERLRAVLSTARVPVRRGLPDGFSMRDAYAACEVVVVPSDWEGFGLPLIESAFHRRPLAVAGFPVASELAALGFSWSDLNDLDRIASEARAPEPSRIRSNERIARAHFGADALTRRLASVIGQVMGEPSLRIKTLEDHDAADGPPL